MRSAFQHLVDLLRRQPVLREEALRSRRRQDREAVARQHGDRRQEALLVLVPHGDEDYAGLGQDRARAELALQERDAERAIEPHDLAGRAHFRAEQHVDAGEAGEGEHRLLHRDVALHGRSGAEPEALQRLAGHDAGGDLRDLRADHLGDERHRAGGARIDLEHVDDAVLDGVLHVHQSADVERQSERLGLPLELRHGLGRERARGQGAGGIARMDARLLDVLHDAGDVDGLAVAQAIHVDLGGVGEVAVEQERILAQHRVDLAGLVVGIARLHVRRDQRGQGAE